MGMPSRCDIAIIGGAMLGSCVAYFVKLLNPGAEVVVIEPDPSYEFASSLRASGGCRVQFTTPENIQMSLASMGLIKDFTAAMSTPEFEAHADWVEGGYLFIVAQEHTTNLERNVRIQQSHGASVDLLTPNDLKARWPSMHTEDLGAGAYSPKDGWCDPHGLLWGFRRKAAFLGTSFMKDRVMAAEQSRTEVTRLKLESGAVLRPSHVVNAAGPWSGVVANLFGMNLPVSPMKRFEHYFTAGKPIERLPYVKDLARLAFRSEGEGFSGGLVDGSAKRGFDFEVDHHYFENVMWPALAHRFPAFEAARCHRTWSGLYEVSELDGNPIIGRWNEGLANLYTVSGFSGHGMMHAPAAGRAIAELITHGAFQTIDLSRLGYERITANRPYAEQGIL